MNRWPLWLFLGTILSIGTAVEAETKVEKQPEVPSGLAFVRTLDIQSYVERIQDHGRGAQSFRARLRYLDPDVNAFVGLVTGVNHFNQDLRIGNPTNEDTASILWNWGADIGIRRGRHLWELDLMGTSLSSRIGPALAIVGEHHLSHEWFLYHRTEADVFTGDLILDADQGLYWSPAWWGLELGYRYFVSQHMNRSGPHVGIHLLFENPKIPFIFPSIG